ncbi:aldehyde dehydrogenase [Trametes polyzona]|nr:aldehyde dehydrogenase [Trametes polyzona]
MSLSYTPINDIPQIHETARRAWLSGKAKSVAFRKQQIAQVGYLVKDNEQRFKDALKADLGRPYLETEFFDFGIVYAEARTVHDNIEKWTAEQSPGFSPNWFFMKPRLRPEPKGVVLIIAPFNYPLFLLLVPLISAIAGGNAVVLKAPEHTPAFSGLLAELLPRYLDQELYHVINGAVPETTKVLELRWDHSNGRVARIVSQAAAKHLTPLTLENPVFVDHKVDLVMTARRVLWGRICNAGQICMAPEYVLVPEEIQGALVAALKEANSDSFGRIVTQAHAARIKALIDNTEGNVEFGGEVDVLQKYVAPTVVSNVGPHDSLMEIFGPVLVLVPVKNVDEAIAIVNSRDIPLAVYVFSHDETFQGRVKENTQSGTFMVNETLIAVATPGLPAGGKGASGHGYYTGKHGFDQFVHQRVSLNNPTWVDRLVFRYRFPPYSPEAVHKLRAAEASLPPRPGSSELASGMTLAITLATLTIAGTSVFAALRSLNRV